MVKTFIFAFLLCGSICGIAQILVDNTKLTPGHITSLFVVIGSILEFFNLYEPLRKLGNVGASLPISSFGSLMMKGVKEMVDEMGIIGIFYGPLTNTSGIICFAIFLAFLAAILFKAKS